MICDVMRIQNDVFDVNFVANVVGSRRLQRVRLFLCAFVMNRIRLFSNCGEPREPLLRFTSRFLLIHFAAYSGISSLTGGGGWNSDVVTVNHHNFFKFISLQCGTVLMLQHRATAVQPSNRRFQPSVSGLVATKQHPSPFEHSDVVTTTNEDDEYDDSSQRGER